MLFLVSDGVYDYSIKFATRSADCAITISSGFPLWDGLPLCAPLLQVEDPENSIPVNE